MANLFIQNMTDDKKIEAIVNALKDNAFGDIQRASAGGSKMGAFILCSCLIDAISGFMKGSDTKGPDYKSFVRKNLTSYDKAKMYTDLRCKLVHSYSEGGSYWFSDRNPSDHLKTRTDGKIIINLENFVAEIQHILDKYCDQLKDPANKLLREKAIRRFDNNGIISVVRNNLSTDSISGANCLSDSLSGRA